MKFYLLFIFISLNLCSFSARATDTIFVYETQVPILIERQDNMLFLMRLTTARSDTKLNEVVLRLGQNVNLSNIQSIKLYYGGTEARQNYGKELYLPVTYISRDVSGKTLAANPSYSINKSQVNNPGRKVILNANQKLFPGINYFWISLQMKPGASLLDKVSAKIVTVKVDNKEALIYTVSPENITHRVGVGVRHAGDDGSAAFRIPGLATTNKGTLLGVYDVRYNSSVDLQEHMDNTTWVVAAWTHGMGNQRAWWSSYPGMDMNHTAQLVLSKSTDDGKTWSEPINITDQVKEPSWYFLLQGPGRGITMQDGTLVFPIQFIDSTRVPNAGIMYSKDRGETWKIHNYARTNTTEAQVAEVEPGVLMLNMRDNRGGSRAVATTKDLGKTWTEHPSSRKALQEPVCMASLISVKAADNTLNKDILLFSNPNTVKGRHHITIKASLDGGITWLPEHQVMLDEGDGWGYSCLTMIDKETVGINPTERYNTIGIIIRPVIMKNRLILFIYIIINLCTISVVKGAVQKVG